MPLAAHNAKIQDFLGDKKIGKPLWDIFYGVELEYEIDKKSKFALANPNISSKVPGQYENSPLVHHVCDVLTPKFILPCHSFIKRDGSLSDGIEIVTLPTGLREYQGGDLKGGKAWIDLFHNLPDYGVVVRATCGMHVHVSREFLTPLQIGKMLKFIHSKENFEFIKCMAGRTPPNKYANIVDPKKVTDVSKHTNRYDGINLTGFQTVEFRIFKSTLKLERMLANVEFCDALVSLTWPSIAGLGNSDLSSFLHFVRKNRKRYPSLFSFLVGKKYFAKSKMPRFTKAGKVIKSGKKPAMKHAVLKV